MGPRKKSGGEGNQASGSKQASGVTLPQLSLLVPKSSRTRASNADGGRAGARELLLAHLAGEQAAKPRASSWLGCKQQPSEKLAATSSAPFSLPPLAMKEGVLARRRSFHPTPVPTWWVCGGVTEGPPQRLFAFQTHPHFSRLVLGSHQCSWTARLPYHPPCPRYLCHSRPGPVSQAESKWSESRIVPRRGPLLCPLGGEVRHRGFQEEENKCPPSPLTGCRAIYRHYLGDGYCYPPYFKDGETKALASS